MIHLQEIKDYANAHSYQNGWQILLESWEDCDILAFCQKFKINDTSQAIQALNNGLSIYDLND